MTPIKNSHFDLVKSYLLDLNIPITYESQKDSILVVSRESDGINNLILGIATPILIMEQHIFDIKNPTVTLLSDLLKKNRDMVHGAFVLDQTGCKVIFRDTLQLENLDLNEFEASLNSLSLVLSEYSENIINYSK